MSEKNQIPTNTALEFEFATQSLTEILDPLLTLPPTDLGEIEIHRQTAYDVLISASYTPHPLFEEIQAILGATETNETFPLQGDLLSFSLLPNNSEQHTILTLQPTTNGQQYALGNDTTVTVQAVKCCVVPNPYAPRTWNTEEAEEIRFDQLGEIIHLPPPPLFVPIGLDPIIIDAAHRFWQPMLEQFLAVATQCRTGVAPDGEMIEQFYRKLQVLKSALQHELPKTREAVELICYALASYMYRAFQTAEEV